MIFSWLCCPSVLVAFLRSSNPRRYQSDLLIVIPIGVAYHKKPEFCAHAEQEIPILLVGVVRIMDQNALLIEEDRGSFREGDAMLPLILTIFGGVPIKTDIHMTII